MGNRTRVNAVRQGINVPRKAGLNYAASFWCSDKQDMPLYLKQDCLIRKVINDFIYKDEILRYSVDKVEINRNTAGTIFIKIFCAKPGRLVGVESSNIKLLEKDIFKRLIKSGLHIVSAQKIGSSSEPKINLSVAESFRPEINPQLIANEIAKIMVDRGNYTKYIRSIINNKNKSRSVRGIRIETAGRLSGASIARRETNSIGLMGLSSFNKYIEQGFAAANTVKGTCSVRVTIETGGRDG